jgi:molybdenum cofactor biosynthesis enzyme MoaA
MNLRLKVNVKLFPHVNRNTLENLVQFASAASIKTLAILELLHLEFKKKETRVY